MNNRLNIQDLAGLLSEHTGKDRNDIERFLRYFISVVSEGVYSDKVVKVKGLGTFKIILVEKRESIHVNTGERFLIPSHYKFSFLPDKDLRELVNKPFSIFETTEINDNVDFSDMGTPVEEKDTDTEDESVEEIMPDNEIPLADEREQPEVVEPEEVRIESESIPDPIPEEAPVEGSDPKSGLELEREPKPEPQFEGDTESEHEFEAEPEPESEPSAESQPIDPPVFVRPKPNHKGVFVGAVLVILLIISCVSIYLDRNIFREKPGEEEIRTEERDTLISSSGIEALDSVQQVEEKPSYLLYPDSVAKNTPHTDPAPYQAPKTKTLGKVKIKHGDRLTVIALEHYGNKLFWVYIYQYNKAIIKDPNNVPIGTVIDIPAPELYGIDAKSKASREKAAALQTEILSGK